MKNSLLLLVLFLAISACSDNEQGPFKPSKVNIRLANTSDFDYSNVFVSTGGGEFMYGDINSSGMTDYHEFDWAFSYAYIELRIGDDVYKIQPIDYVGE